MGKRDRQGWQGRLESALTNDGKMQQITGGDRGRLPSVPTFRTGKICYLIIPAKKVEESASFYERSFGWNIRERSTGSPSFDDTTGDVSGTWTTDREPDPDPGIQIYIMVADVRSAAERVEAAGGSIVLPAGEYGGEHLAHFCDPAGNLMGIYQQPGLADQEAASGKGGVPTRHEV